MSLNVTLRHILYREFHARFELISVAIEQELLPTIDNS